MSPPDIVFHPTVTMRKYHDGDALPFGWTAECAVQELSYLLPDTRIALGTIAEFEAERFKDVRVMLTGIAPREILATVPKVEWIQFSGSGADHFFKASKLSPDDYRRMGITILNSPGISKYPVAEHALAMMLALARGLPRAVRQQSRREWAIFSAGEMRRKTLGIIGLGEIGERVASLARAFGMHVVGCKRRPDIHDGNAHRVVGIDKMGEVIASSDYLLLLTPLSQETAGLFTYDTFRSMKRSAFFINVSRGENVNEDDLVCALRDSLIAGAAVDTFGPLALDDPKKLEALSPTSKLWDLPNMLVIPNNAASSEYYMEYFAEAVADNYRRWRSGKPFRSVAA